MTYPTGWNKDLLTESSRHLLCATRQILNGTLLSETLVSTKYPWGEGTTDGSQGSSQGGHCNIDKRSCARTGSSSSFHAQFLKEHHVEIHFKGFHVQGRIWRIIVSPAGLWL